MMKRTKYFCIYTYQLCARGNLETMVADLCQVVFISVFSGRKHERSPRENPPNGDFGGFLHGDLSPRQAKIRQTVAKNATHGKWRFFGGGAKSPCENTKKSPFGGFLSGDLSRFRFDNTLIRHGTNQPPYETHQTPHIYAYCLLFSFLFVSHAWSIYNNYHNKTV